jgi:hypothetical protein
MPDHHLNFTGLIGYRRGDTRGDEDQASQEKEYPHPVPFNLVCSGGAWAFLAEAKLVTFICGRLALAALFSF